MQPLGPILRPKMQPGSDKKRYQKKDPKMNHNRTPKGTLKFTKNRLKSALFWGPFLRSLLDPFGEPQERPKRAQERPKRGPTEPKRQLREPKRAPKEPQEGPRETKSGPRDVQECPREPKRGQEWPKRGPRDVQNS